MRVRAWACATVVALLAGRAHADDPTIPPEAERFEISDVTTTMRADNFSALAVDPADGKTAYVGTDQGRIYKTTDGGRTWNESTVLPERKLLWQAPGATIYFGGLRGASGYETGEVNEFELSPRIGTGDPRVPSELEGLGFPDHPSDPLEDASASASGGGGGLLGVGLSARSPRLSLLSASRGRPVPTLNRFRFLNDRGQRATRIITIAVDPENRRSVFAATADGLYHSRDAGESWSRSFAGLTPAERLALIIAIRPGDQFMILGTGNGAYSSTDQGDNWAKITTVGGFVNQVAFDTKDGKYVYLATSGGVLRSVDRGASFQPIYYSTLPAENDVRWMTLDPFDPETAYIGTNRGAFVSHDLHAAFVTWQALEGMQSVLQVLRIGACSTHKNHLYAMTRIDLTTINYGAPGPESAIIESWDAGKSWRPLFTGMSDGAAEAMAIAPDDPDQLWIAWSTAVHRLARIDPAADTRAARIRRGEPMPAMGDVIKAALRYQGVELDDYTDMIHRPKFWNILPRTVTVTGTWQQFTRGGTQDDAQFAQGRYFDARDVRGWAVVVWASWNLPDLVYTPTSVAMLRQREQILDDELRRRITETVERSYVEAERIRAELATTKLDTKTEVLYRLRLEQLEAVVDLTSGGYLNRWHEKQRKRP
jgi:hypothetical protein